MKSSFILSVFLIFALFSLVESRKLHKDRSLQDLAIDFAAADALVEPPAEVPLPIELPGDALIVEENADQEDLSKVEKSESYEFDETQFAGKCVTDWNCNGLRTCSQWGACN